MIKYPPLVMKNGLFVNTRKARAAFDKFLLQAWGPSAEKDQDTINVMHEVGRRALAAVNDALKRAKP